MRSSAVLVFAVLAAAAVPIQSPDALLSDTRLTVHALVREDIFAGFMDGNLERMARAETNIEKLLNERPDQRPNLIAWRSGAGLYRAVLAHESGNTAEFQRLFTAAQTGFAEAATATSGNDGVAAITGGSFALWADRLPGEHRAAAWNTAWANYSQLWKAQAPAVAELPVHFKGELLAGLAQSAQRTGRTADMQQFLDRMLEHLTNTPYEPMARKWKEDPSVAATTNLTCKNCHNPGRLAARVKALEKAR